MSYRRDQQESLTLKLDYDQLMFEALRKVNTAFDSPEFAMQEQHTKFGGSTTSASHIGLDRYENYVLNVLAHVQPEWVEKDNDKFPERYAKWAAKVPQFLIEYDAWQVQHAAWEEGSRDPLKEPIEPVNPGASVFGDIVAPKPFSIEVRECKVDGRWKPMNLYHVILAFLHRKGFFKRFEIETIEAGEAEETLEKEVSGQPETLPPVGGPTTATSGTELRKPSLPSSPVV